VSEIVGRDHNESVIHRRDFTFTASDSFTSTANLIEMGLFALMALTTLVLYMINKPREPLLPIYNKTGGSLQLAPPVDINDSGVKNGFGFCSR
jgi:hypothetical protein